MQAEIDLETSRIMRLQGRPAEAERWAQKARNALRSYGEGPRARANLEHVLAARGRYVPERTITELRKCLARGRFLLEKRGVVAEKVSLSFVSGLVR